jgi:hypothetical protein
MDTLMKTTNTLVDDIYNLVQYKSPDRSVDAEQIIDDFGEACKALMRKEFTQRGSFDGRKLRMSNIGKTDRYLWNHYNNVGPKEKMQPHTLVKFMYGHLIEEMLLLFVRLAGHTVTHEQAEAEVQGIKGSMDCKIDGVVTDVKSASTFGFKKFKDATLAFDDPFGYIDQIKGYARSEGETEVGWLAMDKANGHLTFLKYDLEDKQAPVYEVLGKDIEDRIIHIKEMVEQKEPPELCYETVPDGKSGNMKLATGCSYCHFKHACYPNLRTFAYSYGPRYLTEVVNEPKVQEIL